MATKPTQDPINWAPTDPLDVVEPDGSKKLQGYQPEEPLPAEHFNWFLVAITEWFAYFIEIFSVQIEQPSGGDFPLGLDIDSNHVSYWIDSSAARIIELPELDTENITITIKDITGLMDINNCTLERFDSGDTIEGLQEDYILEAPFGSWTLQGRASTNSWRFV